MKCHFCEATAATTETAIDAGWVPDFWRGDEDVSEPVCPTCADAYLIELPGGDRLQIAAPAVR